MTTEHEEIVGPAPPPVFAAATNNVRALIEAFRQERDLYAARLAELQERHDRLRSLCDRLNAANELLIVLMRGAYGEAPGHPDCGAADMSVSVRVRPCPSVPVRVLRRPRIAHCVCCDALIVRRRYYAGTEGPFCRLCGWVRLEQLRKEAARAGRAQGGGCVRWRRKAGRAGAGLVRGEDGQ